VNTAPAPRPHRPRRRFGQHFLVDPNIVARLVAALAPQPGERIVEIGPGTGALSDILATRLVPPSELYLIELDRDLAAVLAERYRHHAHIRVEQADALDYDFTALAAGRPLRLIGNLPYNISTPLLFHFFAAGGAFRDLTLMVQREVAARLLAAPGNRVYGRLSVMGQYHCTGEHLFDVPATAFRPPPKVLSSVIRLIPRPPRLAGAAEYERFATLVKTAFNQRRKTLRNCLAPLLDAEAIRAAGLDPQSRPEILAVEDFLRLVHPIVA